MPTASRQKASRLLCCSSSFISACAVLSPTAASITGPTLNADPIAGSRRPIIVPMQQSRKSSICSPPLDAGLPLLESFSQTSAGLESKSKFQILGLFRGVGLPFRFESAPVRLPNMIWLYRRPILAYWSVHKDPLEAIIAHVLVH